MDIKLLFYKIKHEFFPRFCKKGEFNYILRSQGISVGEKTIFYDSKTMQIDRSRPYLLKIGSYCKITAGVTILTHDYSRSVMRRVYGEIIGDGAETVIGDNVFIGMNSVILMGTHIGNNVIVGAGSVVSGIIPDNVVVAGNPAKIVRTLEEHYEIWKQKSVTAAKECYLSFVKYYHRRPNIKEMDPFWQLFLERDENVVRESGVCICLNGDESESVMKDFLVSKPLFAGYKEFVDFCEEGEEVTLDETT